MIQCPFCNKQMHKDPNKVMKSNLKADMYFCLSFVGLVGPDHSCYSYYVGNELIHTNLIAQDHSFQYNFLEDKFTVSGDRDNHFTVLTSAKLSSDDMFIPRTKEDIQNFLIMI